MKPNSCACYGSNQIHECYCNKQPMKPKDETKPFESRLGDKSIAKLLLNSSGVYKITSPDNKIYIGQSINVKRRYTAYTCLSATKGISKLYESLCAYGINSHLYEIIEYCNIEKLDELEIYYINKYNSMNIGLNCQKGGKYVGGVSDIGRLKLREQMKKRMEENPELWSGKAGVPKSLQHKLNLSASKKLSGCMVGGKNPKAKIVLHELSGIFYDCLKDACKVYNINYSNARNRLQGKYKNNTNLIYA